MAVTPMTSGQPAGGQAGSAGALRARMGQIREIERSSGPAAAEAALVAALREGPQSPQAFLALARLLSKQGKLEDALRAAAKAKAMAPLEAEPLVALGLIHLRMDRPAVAAEAFADALRLEPGSIRAQLGAAAVKMAAEDYEDALALVDRVLDADPTMERAHELMARIKVKMGRTDGAIEDLRALIQKNPENRRVLRAYVGLMRRENREGEALAFLEEDAAAHPDDRRRAARFARVAALAGRSDVAAEQFEQKARDGEASQADRMRFITSLIRAGDLDRAREMIGTLGSQRVMKPISLKLEGDILLKSGDPQGAIGHYEAACRAARVDGLDPGAEAEGASPEARAKLWRAHAQASLVAAFRERRARAEG